ncbi:MAG: hypothetical protein ABIW76_08790 [Fibrobacteria bacterium]
MRALYLKVIYASKEETRAKAESFWIWVTASTAGVAVAVAGYIFVNEPYKTTSAPKDSLVFR